MAGLIAHLFGMLGDGKQRSKIPTPKDVPTPISRAIPVPKSAPSAPDPRFPVPKAATLITGGSGLASNQATTGKTLLGS